MKNISVAIAILFLLFPSSGSGQFEGRIEMNIATDDGAGTTESVLYTMTISGGRIAAELHAEGEFPVRMKSIFDPGRNALWIVDDAKKVFIEIPVRNGRPIVEGGDTTLPPADHPVVAAKKLKSRSLLGQKCEVWEFAGDGGTTTIWGAPGYEDLVETMSALITAIGSLFGEETDAAWRLVGEKKLLPIRSVSVTDDGMRETQEITKIERKKVLGSIYEIPAGYARQESLVPFQMEGDTDDEHEEDEPQ